MTLATSLIRRLKEVRAAGKEGRVSSIVPELSIGQEAARPRCRIERSNSYARRRPRSRSMPHRKSRLKLKHQDLAVNADIRAAKLDPEDIGDDPEIIRRDERTGGLLVRQVYDKESGEPLEEGYGYRWVNEEGEEVPDEDVQLYAVGDEEERPFSKHEPTVGSERVLTAETWIPVAQVDEYLVEKVYELYGEDAVDVAQLFELAEHIRDFDEAPVVPFVLQASIYRKWGIVTPIFYDEEFALIVRVTTRKIEPEHRMAVRTQEEVEEARERAEMEEAPTLEQESPFE